TLEAATESQTEMRADWPTVIFGTKSRPCGKEKNCYCEGDRGICLLINPHKVKDYSTGSNLSTNTGIGKFEIISSYLIKITMLEDNSSFLSSVDNKFYVFEDVKLNNIFDYEVTLKKGVYDIDYSQNSLGTIMVNYE